MGSGPADVTSLLILLGGGTGVILMLTAAAAIWNWQPAGLVAASAFTVLGLLLLPGYALIETLGDAWDYYCLNPAAAGQSHILCVDAAYTFFFFLPSILLALGTIMGALLLRSGVQTWRAASDSTGGRPWLAAAVFTLCGALTGAALIYLYRLTLWDSTYDPLGYLWIFLPVMSAVLAGFILAWPKPLLASWTGVAYALVVSGLLIAVSTLAQRVDIHALTARRADAVQQALEYYYLDSGHYPSALEDLRPRYLLTLPGPVIINGQGWCYSGEGDHYRLGYLTREHWSDPNFTAQLHSQSGDVSALPPLCDREIAALPEYK